MALKLSAIILAQPAARALGSGRRLDPSETPFWQNKAKKLAPSRPISAGELQSSWVSPAWRASDIPIPFHPDRADGSIDFNQPLLIGGSKPSMSVLQAVQREARVLQYLFDDGLCLYAGEVLRHPVGRSLPRLLLPLTLNSSKGLEGYSLAHLDIPVPGRGTGSDTLRPGWLVQFDETVLAVVHAIERLNQGLYADEADPIRLLFTTEEDRDLERTVYPLTGIGFGSTSSESESPRGSSFELSVRAVEPVEETAPEIFQGRIEIKPLVSNAAMTDSFLLDDTSERLLLHRYKDEVNSLLDSIDSGAVENKAGVLAVQGHGAIQLIFETLREAQRDLQFETPVQTIAPADLKPQLDLFSDGTFRLSHALSDRWCAIGLPRSLHYVIGLLSHGLGGVTAIDNLELAHQRKGPKRDRDLRLLRNVGLSHLLFFEISSQQLGLPTLTGEILESTLVAKDRVFRKMVSFLAKSETQSGADSERLHELRLDELVSDQVMTLLSGVVDQLISDLAPNRETLVATPEAIFSAQGLTRNCLRLIRSLVADLITETDGAAFSKVKGEWWHGFYQSRTGIEQEDIGAVRLGGLQSSENMGSDRTRFKTIHDYVVPTTTRPPRGIHLLGLAHEEWHLSLDSQAVELIQKGEFRPEFSLKESVDGSSGSPNSKNTTVELSGGRIDWFELHPRFFFRGQELRPEDAIRLSKEGIIEHNGQFFLLDPAELPSLKRLTRFWASLHGDGQGILGDAKKRRSTAQTFFQLPKARSLELLALRASGIAIQGGTRWKEICAFYDQLDKERPPLVLPESFQATLQPYQHAGVQWLLDIRNLDLGGILADDMGLGKTVTSLGFLEILRSRNQLGPTLVLVPTSLTYNWVSEIEKFTPGLKTHLFSSKDPEGLRDFVLSRETGVVISTYGLLQENDHVFEQIEWDNIIFDEAQALKTITTKRTTAARKLKARFKLCLTGTPLENHYGEFYSLFDLCVPGSLGEISDFRERYVNPPRILIEDLDELKLRTKPLLLRRTKKQVMHQLPDKIETTLKLPFDDEQKRIYRDIATSYNRQIKDQIAKEGEAKSQLQMLTALLRLRQVCSDPSGIPGVNYESDPPKVSTLMDALAEIVDEGSSALVFTQFLATFERIRSAMTSREIPFFDMSGSDSRGERERKLRGFNEKDGGAVMLMTLKTGGVGLNLTKASYIFHIEPWWNPAVENQATDRAHRMGQTKSVQVYRYIIRDSVEEKIEILKSVKSQRFDALLGTGAGQIADSESPADLTTPSSRLSQKDFEFLLN